MQSQRGAMRIAGIAALAVFGAACGGAQGASDRPRIVAADSAFRADSATLAAIVQRDAAERRQAVGTHTSGGFGSYAGDGPAALAAFSSTDPPPPAAPALDATGVRAVNASEAARYLRGKKGRVTLAILYGTRCPRSKAMFPGFGALSPLGFGLTRAPWDRPYVAVLDPQGSVVAQWNAATNLAAIDAAIQSQLAR